MRKRIETVADFYERSARAAGCYEWQGAVSSSTGYGKVRFRGVTMDAHRAIWVAAHGPITSGLFVMHSCDNRKCISLAHLSLGTPSDNMRDAASKGRIPSSAPVGEAAGRAKLKHSQVIEILQRLNAGEPGTSIAPDYGVDRSAISKIKRGVSWSRALHEECAA